MQELNSKDVRWALRESLLSGIEMKWEGKPRETPESVAAFNMKRISKLYQEGIEKIRGYGSIEKFVEKTTLDHPITYIFEEILTNASDAYARIGKQGPILFRIKETENNYVFEVLDNGWGYFPRAQNLPISTQIPGNYYSREGGRGIGVEWSRILAQAYGGDLEFFEPTDAGYVTGVRVTLPKTSVSLKVVDKAMIQDETLTGPKKVVEPASQTGGIDLTPANMHLQTQNAGAGIKFRLYPAMLEQLQNAPGFVPVIINIQPLGNLQKFLGVNVQKSVAVSA